jgi:hypothetical protein
VQATFTIYIAGGITAAAATENALLLRLGLACYARLPVSYVTVTAVNATLVSASNPMNQACATCAALSFRRLQRQKHPLSGEQTRTQAPLLPPAALRVPRRLDGDTPLVISTTVSGDPPALVLLRDLFGSGSTPINAQVADFVEAAAAASGVSPGIVIVTGREVVAPTWTLDPFPSLTSRGESSEGLSAPVIIGIIVGAGLGIVLCIIAVMWVLERRGALKGWGPMPAHLQGSGPTFSTVIATPSQPGAAIARSGQASPDGQWSNPMAQGGRKGGSGSADRGAAAARTRTSPTVGSGSVAAHNAFAMYAQPRGALGPGANKRRSAASASAAAAAATAARGSSGGGEEDDDDDDDGGGGVRHGAAAASPASAAGRASSGRGVVAQGLGLSSASAAAAAAAAGGGAPRSTPGGRVIIPKVRRGSAAAKRGGAARAGGVGGGGRAAGAEASARTTNPALVSDARVRATMRLRGGGEDAGSGEGGDGSDGSEGGGRRGGGSRPASTPAPAAAAPATQRAQTRAGSGRAGTSPSSAAAAVGAGSDALRGSASQKGKGAGAGDSDPE